MRSSARLGGMDKFYVDLMPVMPYATADGANKLKSVLQFLVASQPKAATASPEEFYDMSYSKKIEASGFTKSLAARR